MPYKKICVTILAVWALLCGALWFSPRQELSESERRPLAQMPQISVKTVLDGSFMSDFSDFTLDQFPLRDGFRTLKSLFHTYILGQKDNNGIYLSHGYAAKMEYPLNETSLSHAAERFSYLQEKYLTDSRVFLAIVPDKGYYLAEGSGHLSLDYDSLYAQMAQALPEVSQIDLRDTLSLEDYYRTDTHWRQENLIETANRIRQELGLSPISPEDYTVTALERPFRGVYFGQAALPMKPDTMYLLERDILSDCRVFDHETGAYSPVYDRSKLTSRDLYDVFLSGAKPLLTIENPNAPTDRELIVFRDSFGSSLIPLLADGYAKVTVIDIRYIRIDLLEQFVAFSGQDVLLLYSTLVLNNSQTIQ